MLVDRRGVPLSFVITEANKHDMKSAFPTIALLLIDLKLNRTYAWIRDMISLR